MRPPTFGSTRTSSRPRGFSLVELLIIIGILAVLMSLLLPSVSRIRQQARTTQCASNLHQIHQAALVWQNENSRVMGTEFRSDGWMTRWKEYVKTADSGDGGIYPQVMYCPEDERPLTVSAGVGTNGKDASGYTKGGTGAAAGTSDGGTRTVAMQDLVLRIETDQYGTYDVPMAPGPRVKISNVTPTSYVLGIEQQPVHSTQFLDYNDTVIKFEQLPNGTTQLTLMTGSVDYSQNHARSINLIDLATGKTVWPNIYKKPSGTQVGAKTTTESPLAPVDEQLPNYTPPGGVSTGTGKVTASSVVAHYGFNTQIDGVMGKGNKVLGMDYIVDQVDPDVDQWKGDKFIEPSTGALRFARHKRQVNVLFGDGAVTQVPMVAGDKDWDPSESPAKYSAILEKWKK